MKEDSINKNYLLSIIIPCYNNHSTVIIAIESAIRQTYPNKEIIVVDDGSNIKTKEVLASLKPSIDFLLTQENKGPSAARNKGIEKAGGNYILVLDADDYFEPEFAEKAIEVLDSNSKIKVVTCYGRWFESNKKSVIHKPTGGGIDYFMYQCGAFGSTLFKKKNWEIIGGYDEEMRLGFEDWEFYIRLLKDGGQSYVIPEILFHYRKTKNSRNSVANNIKYEIWKYIYLKHSKLYIDDYERFIIRITSLLQQQEDENKRIRNKPEFRIGHYLLLPLRKIKNFLPV